jgi:hypothetical protein
MTVMKTLAEAESSGPLQDLGWGGAKGKSFSLLFLNHKAHLFFRIQVFWESIKKMVLPVLSHY